jgi:hypothetical protein
MLYCLVGTDILKRRHNLKFTGNYTTQTTIMSDNVSFDHLNNAAAMSVEVNVQSQSVHIAESHGRKESAFASSSKCSTVQISTSHLRPFDSIALDHRTPKRSPVSFKQYILMPVMFFVILLIIWLAPTINRISAFINPDYVSYPLLLAVGIMSPLRGFWNGVIFITIGIRGRKRQKKLEKRTVTSSGSTCRLT